jgi:uncharacterized protein
VNLSSALPGWTRFEPAEAWLNSNRPQASVDQKRAQFEAFLEARGFSDPQHELESPEQHERLFEEFLRWSRAREARPTN